MPGNKTKSYDEKLAIDGFEVDFVTVHKQLKENALRMRYQLSRMPIRRKREELIRKIEAFRTEFSSNDSELFNAAIEEFCEIFFELRELGNKPIYSSILDKLQEVSKIHISSNILKNKESFKETLAENVNVKGLCEIVQIVGLKEFALSDVPAKKRKVLESFLKGSQHFQEASSLNVKYENGETPEIFSPNKFTKNNLRSGVQTRGTNLGHRESFLEFVNQENFALANLGLVFEFDGKKRFFSMPVKSKDFNFVTLENFYENIYKLTVNNKEYVRDREIDEFLKRKHKNSSEKPNPAVPNYEQKYYHSEAALIYLLENPEFQKSFLQAFKKSLIDSGVLPKASLSEEKMKVLALVKAAFGEEHYKKLYQEAMLEEQEKLLSDVKILGKIVDLYSSRKLCSRCQPMVDSLLEPDSDLQKSMNEALKKEGFSLSDDEKLHVRVSTNAAMYEKDEKAAGNKRSRSEISTKAPEIPLSPSFNFAAEQSNDYSLFVSGTDRNRAYRAGLNL